jgi:AraC-like DNA-binding protein
MRHSPGLFAAGSRTRWEIETGRVPTRSHFARALLQDRSLSVGDIAFFLQYSEPAAFHRSFRRWTGLTPHAFREA